MPAHRPAHTKTAVSRLLPAIVLAVSVGLAGCGGGDTEASPTPVRMPAPHLLVAEDARLPFSTVTQGSSGIQDARQVVVRDQASFAKLWQEHETGLVLNRSMPVIDFSSKMVIAVSAGLSQCKIADIHRIGTEAGKIVVEYREYEERADCHPVTSAPLHMVTVARSEAALDFIKVWLERPRYTTVEQSDYSNIFMSGMQVVRDSKAWTALWHAHVDPITVAGSPSVPSNRPVPEVDFAKYMVIAVAVGAGPNGCHGGDIVDITRVRGRLQVQIWLRGVAQLPGRICTLSVTSPVHFVQIERSDEVVELADNPLTTP